MCASSSASDSPGRCGGPGGGGCTPPADVGWVTASCSSGHQAGCGSVRGGQCRPDTGRGSAAWRTPDTAAAVQPAAAGHRRSLRRGLRPSAHCRGSACRHAGSSATRSAALVNLARSAQAGGHQRPTRRGHRTRRPDTRSPGHLAQRTPATAAGCPGRCGSRPAGQPTTGHVRRDHHRTAMVRRSGRTVRQQRQRGSPASLFGSGRGSRPAPVVRPYRPGRPAHLLIVEKWAKSRPKVGRSTGRRRSWRGPSSTH